MRLGLVVPLREGCNIRAQIGQPDSSRGAGPVRVDGDRAQPAGPEEVTDLPRGHRQEEGGALPGQEFG